MAKFIPDTKQSLSSHGGGGSSKGRGRGRGRMRETNPVPVNRVERSNYNLRNVPKVNYCEETSNSSPIREPMETEVHIPNEQCEDISNKKKVSPSQITPIEIEGQTKGRGRGSRGRGKVDLLSPTLQNRCEGSPYNLRMLQPNFEENSFDLKPIETKTTSEVKNSNSDGESEKKEIEINEDSALQRSIDFEVENIPSRHPNLVFFWKTQSPFSQFHPAHFVVKEDNYICAEQYMMAGKARLFRDSINLVNIMEANEPKVMKSFGRKVEEFKPEIWNMCCRQIVQEGNRAKFSQNRHLLESLLNTNEKYLVEASPFDRIWGIGMGASNSKAYTPSSWKGSNWLGEALNQVKFEIQLLIYSSLNGGRSSIYDPSMIRELFKIGICEKFDKMKCEIEISDDEKEKYTNLSQGNKKGYKHTSFDFMREKKQDPSQRYLFQFYPSTTQKEIPVESVKTSPRPAKNDIDNSEDSWENIDFDSAELDRIMSPNPNESVTNPANTTESNENNLTEISLLEKESDSNFEISTLSTASIGSGEQKETTAEVPSPNDSSLMLPDINWNDSSHRSQESGIFSQFNEVSLKDQFSENEISSPLIPPSITTACQYIFADWVREKLLDSPDAFVHFTNMNSEELELIPGFCVYKSVDQLIAPCMKLSQILIDLHSEFIDIKNSILKEKDLKTRYPCTNTLPCRPQKYNLQNIMVGSSLMQDSEQPSLNESKKLNVKSGKNSKKNKKISKTKKMTDSTHSPESNHSIDNPADTGVEMTSSPMELKLDEDISQVNKFDILSDSELPKEATTTPADPIKKRSNSDSKRSSASSPEFYTADDETPSPKPKEAKVAKGGNKGKKKKNTKKGRK